MNARTGIVSILALFFLVGGWEMLPCGSILTVQAQTNKRNVFETRRSTSPNPPRPKADEEITKTLRDGLERGFNSNFTNGNLHIYLIFFVVLFLLLAGLVYYDTNYRKNSSALENPYIVFRELCKAHQLTWTEAKFLKKLAGELELDDPLPFFIEPRYFIGALENKALENSRPTIQYFLKKFFDIRPGQETQFQTQIVKDRLDDRVVGMETVVQNDTIFRKPPGESTSVHIVAGKKS